MVLTMSDDVFFRPLKMISVAGGDVFHGLKQSDDSFSGFGEAYFSFVQKDAVKGWKRHRLMRCNLIVPVGLVVFNCITPDGTHSIYRIGPEAPGSYGRLTIPPGHWFAFGGLASPQSCILNISDIPHDPDESEQKPIGESPWRW